MMKKNRRILSLLLVVSLLFSSSFAGCADENPTEPTADPAVSSESEPSNTSEQESIFPLEEKKTYTIMVRSDCDWETQKLKNTWYQELVERTNAEIQFVTYPDDSHLSGMMPDIPDFHAYIGNLLDASQIVEAAAGGWLLPLEDYLTEEIMPNYVGRGLADVPTARQAMTTTDGHIYTLARLDNASYGAYVESPLTVNKEWMQKAGLSDVSTIEKFEQYLKYVKENDVNGNGDPDDEIPFLVCATRELDAKATLQGILNWWGLPTKDNDMEYYCVVTNGKVELAPQTDAYRAAITKIAEWYQKGYLWDKFFTGKTADMEELLLNSQTAVVGAVNSNAWDLFTQTPSAYADPTADSLVNECVMRYVAPPVPEGYTPRLFVSPDINGCRDCYAISNACTEEDAKTLLAWLDLALFSQEGTFSATYGCADDEDTVAGALDRWNWDTSGKPVLVEGYTAGQIRAHNELVDTLYAVIGDYTYLYTTQDHADGIKEVPLHIRMIDASGSKAYYNTEIWPRPYYTAEQTAELTRLWLDTKSVITNYETLFITGAMEITESNWQAYMKELFQAGANDMVEILQEAYDATV